MFCCECTQILSLRFEKCIKCKWNVSYLRSRFVITVMSSDFSLSVSRIRRPTNIEIKPLNTYNFCQYLATKYKLFFPKNVNINLPLKILPKQNLEHHRLIKQNKIGEILLGM